MSDDKPAVQAGDLVIVLEWATSFYVRLHTKHLGSPHWAVITTPARHVASGDVYARPCPPDSDGWAFKAKRWRRPTQAELAAYQLDQLASQGL